MFRFNVFKNAFDVVRSNTELDARYLNLDGESTNVTNGSFNLTTTGTGTFNKLNIEGPIPILVFKDNTDEGDSARGFQEWRDSNNVRLGFFGNHSYTNDDLKWKNESNGGHLLLETTGGGIVSSNTDFTTTGTGTFTGGITSGGNIVSDTTFTDDLGSTSVYWNKLFIDEIYGKGQTSNPILKIVSNSFTYLYSSSNLHIAPQDGGSGTFEFFVSTFGELRGPNNTNFKISSKGSGELYLVSSGGVIYAEDTFTPLTDSSIDLGTSSKYWRNTYTDKIFLNSTATLDGATAGSIGITGALTFPKASGNGIKVDKTNPTFGWRDLLGKITNAGGANKPTRATYRGGIDQFRFGAGDESIIEFHIPHDYVKGTDIHLHIHWSHIGGFVTGGTLTFTAESSYSKGHNQAPFSSPVTGTFTGTASSNQYQQIISETQLSASSPTGLQIDTDDLEPDGVILMRLEMTTNSMTVSEGAVPDPFIHFIDIHYQSTNIGTKDKAPDFYT